jgi:hypothetical protein
MTNDNTPPKPIEETIRLAILEALAMGMERGLHTSTAHAIVQKIADDLKQDQQDTDRG